MGKRKRKSKKGIKVRLAPDEKLLDEKKEKTYSWLKKDLARTIILTILIIGLELLIYFVVTS